MAFLQYLKDTRGELHHVAWPTRAQTVVYTVLVIAVSLIVSLYLGFFDYLLTTGLGKALDVMPGTTNTPAVEIQTEPAQSGQTIDIDSIIPSTDAQ